MDDVRPEFKRFVEELKEDCEELGYKKGWIFHRVKDDWDGGWVYEELVWLASVLGYKPGWAYCKYQEFCRTEYEAQKESQRKSSSRRSEQESESKQRSRSASGPSASNSSYRAKLVAALGWIDIDPGDWPATFAVFK